MIKQLNLPFAQPNYEYEPLPDDTKHRIKRLEVDYNKLTDGRVKKLTTENKDLYGSIKPTEISKIINLKEKIDVKPSLIQPLNEIKSLGTFKVKINLHSEVQAEINIKVISEDNIK